MAFDPTGEFQPHHYQEPNSGLFDDWPDLDMGSRETLFYSSQSVGMPPFRVDESAAHQGGPLRTEQETGEWLQDSLTMSCRAESCPLQDLLGPDSIAGGQEDN